MCVVVRLDMALICVSMGLPTDLDVRGCAVGYGADLRDDEFTNGSVTCGRTHGQWSPANGGGG